MVAEYCYSIDALFLSVINEIESLGIVDVGGRCLSDGVINCCSKSYLCKEQSDTILIVPCNSNGGAHHEDDEQRKIHFTN